MKLRKEIPIKKLTKTEDKIRWHLQYEHNLMKERNCEKAKVEWDAIYRFADSLVAPKKWALKNGGMVVLMKEVE